MISTDKLWGQLMMTFLLHNKQNGRSCPLTVLLLLLRQWYSIVLVQLHLFWQSILYSIFKLNENKWYTIMDKRKLKQCYYKTEVQLKTKHLKKKSKFCTVWIFSSHGFTFYFYFTAKLMLQIVNFEGELIFFFFLNVLWVLMYGFSWNV